MFILVLRQEITSLYYGPKREFSALEAETLNYFVLKVKQQFLTYILEENTSPAQIF